MALAQSYEITGVPTIIVNGAKQSYMTDTGMAGDGKKVFEIVNFLLEQEGVTTGKPTAPAAPAKAPAKNKGAK